MRAPGTPSARKPSVLPPGLGPLRNPPTPFGLPAAATPLAIAHRLSPLRPTTPAPRSNRATGYVRSIPPVPFPPPPMPSHRARGRLLGSPSRPRYVSSVRSVRRTHEQKTLLALFAFFACPAVKSDPPSNRARPAHPPFAMCHVPLPRGYCPRVHSLSHRSLTRSPDPQAEPPASGSAKAPKPRRRGSLPRPSKPRSRRELKERPKGDSAKAALGARLRRATTLTVRRVAGPLHIDSWKSPNNRPCLHNKPGQNAAKK